MRNAMIPLYAGYYKGQGADLTSHVTYFDPRSQASFLWDGRSDEIEVCIGGYGEPMDHVIPTPWDVLRGSFSMTYFMEEFRSYCQDHAQTLPTIGSIR